MAHVAHHGMSSGSHGNRRGKQRNRNFEALLGMDAPRRSRSRPQLQSQFSAGTPMGACQGVLSVSSSHSDYPEQAAACNLQVCVRAVSVLAVVTGALMLAFGLFLNPGSVILGLCIPGGLMIVTVILLWCVLYVWNGKYCAKSSGSAVMSGPVATGGAAIHRPARGGADEATVELQLSRSGEVMPSYGPDTRSHHHPSHLPPCYSPIDTCGSFPVSSGQSIAQPPSTPPPPYDEVT